MPPDPVSPRFNVDDKEIPETHQQPGIVDTSSPFSCTYFNSSWVFGMPVLFVLIANVLLLLIKLFSFEVGSCSTEFQVGPELA